MKKPEVVRVTAEMSGAGHYYYFHEVGSGRLILIEKETVERLSGFTPADIEEHTEYLLMMRVIKIKKQQDSLLSRIKRLFRKGEHCEEA